MDTNYFVIAGHPDPVVTWYKKQTKFTWKHIVDDHKHRVDKLYGHGPNLDVMGSWSALRILRIQMGDFGTYACRGENIYGASNQTIKFFSE